jgi:hypothetical protein
VDWIVDWIASHIPLIKLKKKLFFLDISLFQSSKKNNGGNMK